MTQLETTESTEALRPGPHTLAGEAKVVFTLLGMVSDIVLDLDMPVSRARELFTLALYNRAEARYRTSTRVSLAFDTALRTVKKIKKRYREGGVEECNGPLFNLRRKVYFMLLNKEMEGQYVGMGFDGTTRLGEAICTTGRWCTKGFYLVKRLLDFTTALKHVNNVQLAGHIVEAA